MKKKILFMIDSLNCGGAEKSLVSLLPLLNRDKYDITLLLEGKNGVFEPLVPNWINKIYLKDQKLMSGIGAIIARICYSIRLRLNGKRTYAHEIRWKTQSRWISSLPIKYDVAIAYGQGFITYFVANKVNATKKLAWINADLTLGKTNLDYNKQFYDKFNYIIPVSDRLNNRISDVYTDLKDKFHTINDIVNPELINQMAMEKFDDNHNSDPNILHLTTVGRIVPPKGYDLLLDAALILKQRGISFIWKIIGTGNIEQLRTEIEQKGLQGNVHLLGLKENPYPYMRSCDIYVQTSRREGLCITLAEAKILHRPIVSTNFSVVYDQIESGKNGIIIEMNGQSIADAIIELRNDASLRNNLITNLELENNVSYLTEVEKVEALIDDKA